MNVNIDISNVIRIDLKNDNWSKIAIMKKMDGKALFQFKLDGYDEVWMEKMSGNYRMVAYSKNKGFSINYKFSNNISKSKIDLISKIEKYPIPSDAEYQSFLDANDISVIVNEKKPKVNKPKSVSPKKSVVKNDKKIASKRVEPPKKPVVKNDDKKVESKKILPSIDKILDKISLTGMDSLTDLEKKYLIDESKKL